MNFSLKKKMFVVVLCIAILTISFTLMVVNKGINDVIEVLFWDRSTGIANLVSTQIDAQRLEEVQTAVREIYAQAPQKIVLGQGAEADYEAYIARFDAVTELPAYQSLHNELQRMQNALDIISLNLSWLDREGRCYVNLIDAAIDDPYPLGFLDPVTEKTAGALEQPAEGYAPNTGDSADYGKLVSTGKPVFNEQGEVIAYVTVELSMNSVAKQRKIFLIIAVIAQIIMHTIVCVIGIRLVNRFIIRPVNKLSKAAEQYTNDRKSFSGLNIPKGDEIGILADSMSRMEREINGYIENMEKTTNDLIQAREQAEWLNTLANVDQLTNTRNKRAFDVASDRLGRDGQPYALVMIDMNNLKQMNDTYGHKKGDIYLKNLCQIIWRSFHHSTVYRVGGDEFIVVLENDDYAEREELIRSIKETFRQTRDDESLPPWERVSAAVGCAEFEPGKDLGIEAVLKRADAEMYRDKREIKGNQ